MNQANKSDSLMMEILHDAFPGRSQEQVVPIGLIYAGIRWGRYYLCCSSSACYLGHPEIYGDPEVFRLGVVTEGFMQGAMEERSLGRELKIIFDFEDIGGFYEYFLALLRN